MRHVLPTCLLPLLLLAGLAPPEAGARDGSVASRLDARGIKYVVDEDGDAAIERQDVEAAVLLHMRLSCTDVGRHYSPADIDVDEDEGVP